MRFVRALAVLSLVFLPVAMTGCKSRPAAEAGGASTEVKAETMETIPAPKSPHRVMAAVAGNASLSPLQLQYLVNMQNKLLTAWRPVPSDKQYSVTCEFNVTRPGFCSDVHVVAASANQRSIEKTLDTVRMQAPFGALPSDFKEAPVTFRCDFVYNPGK